MTKAALAQQFLARGFSVIPLWPKSKQAMHQWTEYQRRLPSPEEVTHWWSEEPDANIGIITGAVSGILVGDVDPRHGGSVADMQRDAPSTHVVKTPGGGAHFYYRHPGGRVTKGKPRPGIDRQSDGCYVVAPGSYVVTESYEGEYAYIIEGDFSEAPAWLLGEPPQAGEAPASRTEAWIGGVLRDGCPPGTRNDTLAKLAGYFAGKSVPEDISAPVLTRWVLGQEGTGVTFEEAAKTIRSIYEKERRKQQAPGPLTYVVDEFAQDDPNRPLETMSLADFGAAYYNEETDWLIPEWLPARSIAFLVSPPGRFKTMLTFDAAISIAGGWPFMGRFPVQDPGPVLVIQQEDDYGDMARRFNRIFAARQPGRLVADFGADDDDVVRGHLAVCELPPVHVCTTRGFTLNIDNLRRLEDVIRRLRPRVVVIDPLYSITSADDFMMHAARDMMPLKRLRDVYDVGFLIAAHTKKGADQGREGLWGSQFLNAFLETGWQIRDREDGEDNQICLKRHFKASGIPPLVNLEFQLDDADGYRITVSDPEEDEPQDAVLAELKRQGEATAVDIAERVGLSPRVVQKRLRKFQESGTVVQAARGAHGEISWTIPKDTTKDLH